MKSVFFALCALVCGSVFAGEMPSVVNHNSSPAPVASAAAPAPAPAAAPDAVPANEVLVIENQPARQIVLVQGAPRRCVNGRCSSRFSAVCTGPNCQKYAINENTTETVRKRWVGGGYVIRNNGRTVVKPVR